MPRDLLIFRSLRASSATTGGRGKSVGAAAGCDLLILDLFTAAARPEVASQGSSTATEWSKKNGPLQGRLSRRRLAFSLRTGLRCSAHHLANRFLRLERQHCAFLLLTRNRLQQVNLDVCLLVSKQTQQM